MSFQSLPPSFELGNQGFTADQTRTEYLSAKMLTAIDAEHVLMNGGIESQIVRPRTGYKVSGAHDDREFHIDPVTPKTLDFGQRVKFTFGFEGPCMLTRVEVHFKVSALTPADNFQWRPWLAEAMLGDEYVLKHQNDTICPVDVTAMHFDRRLNADVSKALDSGYQHAVGADPTPNAQHVYVDLDIPYSESKPLVAHAMGQQHELTFQIPSLLSLIQRQSVGAADQTSTAPVATLDALYLKVYYTDTDQDTRVQLANEALYMGGHKYHTAEFEPILEAAELVFLQGDSASDLRSGYINDLDLLVRPSAYTFVVARDATDLEPLDATVLVAKTGDSQATLNGLGAAATAALNPYPDKFRAAPIVQWEALENRKRIHARQTFEEDCMDVIPRKFNCEPGINLAVVVFSKLPTLARDHSFGHMSWNNLKQPKIQYWLRKLPWSPSDSNDFLKAYSRYAQLEGVSDFAALQAAAAPTYRIDVYSKSYQFVNVSEGRAWRSYI